MNLTSRRGLIAFLPLLIGEGVFWGIVLLSWLTSPSNTLANDDWHVILILTVGIPVALVGLFACMALVRRELRRQIAETTSRLESNGLIGAIYATHRRKTRSDMLWGGVGGLLALSQQDIAFVRLPGQRRGQDLRIPIENLARAVPFQVGPFRRGIRFECTDGSQEVFEIGGISRGQLEHAIADVEKVRDAHLQGGGL